MRKLGIFNTLKTDTLITIQNLINQLPSESVTTNINMSRKRISDIVLGQDNRLLVIVGPCSLHDIDSSLDYAKRLSSVKTRFSDRLEIVMRTYFEKPRTVLGWKGLMFDPNLDDTYQVNKGIKIARKLLLDINSLGVATATEFLNSITGFFIIDLISWGAIGARTTESQIHRDMVSALPCPIGFKNSTDGNIQVAINAVRAAKNSSVYIAPDAHGLLSVYHTKGNPVTHVILRGGKKPNYYPQDILKTVNSLRKFSLPEYIVVDCSHSNSLKQYKKQLNVAKTIAQQIKDGQRAIVGIMIESFLYNGNQQISSTTKLSYGQSVTDPCLGWEETLSILELLYDSLKFRMKN